MKRLFILFFFLSLATWSCRGQFIVDERGKSQETEETTSCYKYDFCHKCGMDFDGDFKCGWKHSAFCPGTKKILVRITPVSGHYEKDPDKIVTRNERIILKELTECN
jgi:hypothetical protein